MKKDKSAAKENVEQEDVGKETFGIDHYGDCV